MEQYRVRLVRAAGRDLRDIANYIAVQLSAPIAASKKVKAIKNALDKKLSYMPQKHRLVNNGRLASMGLRRVNLENYIALFSTDEDNKTVHVERIIHALRDLSRILNSMAEEWKP